MSAFIVGDETINDVIAYLAWGNDPGRIRSLILAETGCDLGTDEGCAALGRMMFDLNCKAIDQRYGVGESQKQRDDTAAYRFERTTRVPKPVQIYKSLQCWHYQCSEGDVPDTSLLYQTMTKVGDQLARLIVHALPAYEKARW